MRPRLTVRLLSTPAQRWLCWALLGLLTASAWAGESQPSANKEYQVKAAFLYNFLKFVEWPATNALAPEAPLIIGVADNSPMLPALVETVKARRISGHALQVKTLRTPVEAKTVQVLFLPDSESKHVADWLGQVAGTAVLTVGESDAFARQHGMINFLLEADKIRFEIDMGAADRAGLTISAQLQKLARSVRRPD